MTDATDIVPDIDDALVADAAADARDATTETDTPDVPGAPDVLVASDVPDVPDVPDMADAPSDVPCPSRQTRCGDGTCIDPGFSDAHCGGCDRPACPAGRTCMVGRCVVRTGDLALGSQHTCARFGGAPCTGVFCWGADDRCQLGLQSAAMTGGSCAVDAGVQDGGTSSCAGFVDQNTAVRVPSLGRTLQVSGGLAHTCALVDDPERHGTVYCWGYNAYGQVGDCTRTDRAAPVRVALPAARFVQVAAGNFHTCALSDEGGVWCWGANNYEALGHGNQNDPQCGTTDYPTWRCDPTPRQVTMLGRVSQVAAGTYSTCALMSVGTVICWGASTSGVLGQGSVSGGGARAPVLGLEDVVQVAVADSSACALHENGDVLCWGNNHRCQLGRPATTPTNVTATRVPGLSGVRQISLFFNHVCAVRNGASSLLCWGDNAADQLTGSPATVHCSDDDPMRRGVATPFATQGLPADRVIREVGVGVGHTCVLLDNLQVWCWGHEANGRLGRVAPGRAPAAVIGLCSL